MTFGAMIAVFIYRSEAKIFWGHITIPSLLWATTAVLLASSGTLEAARHALSRGRQEACFHLLAWTTGLGLAFLVGQFMACVQVLRSGVILQKNPHSWFIFLFSGLHGLHILLGLAGLTYLLLRTREAVSGPKYNLKTKAVASGVSLFWHYLDFLWIVLFGLLIVWQR